MLKFFHKILLVQVLSLTLLTSQITAYAQTGIEAASHRAQMSGVSEGSLLSSITMLAIGFIATRLYDYSPMTTDVGIAAVGGGAFVYGEISSNNKFKELEKDLTVEIAKNSAGEPDSAQVEHIRGLKKSYVDASDILKTKKKLQIAASVAFAAAGVVAFNMKTLDDTAYETYLAALRKSDVDCGSDVSDTTTLAKGGANGRMLGNVHHAYQKVLDVALASQVPLRSAVSQKETTAAVGRLIVSEKNYIATLKLREQLATTKANSMSSTGAGAAAAQPYYQRAQRCKFAANYVNNGANALNQSLKPRQTFSEKLFGSNSSFQNQVPRKSSNYLDRLLDFAMPTAEAGSAGLMFGLTGLSAAIFLKMFPKLAASVDKYLYSSKNRILIWGILGGLSLMAAMATQKEIDKIEENIKKIDGILNAIKVVKNEKTNFFQNIFNMIFPKANAEASKVDAPSKTLTSRVKMPCLAGPGDSNCPSLAGQLNNSGEDLNNLPSSFQTVTGKIIRLSDDLSGATSLNAKTMNEIASIGDQQVAVTSLLAKMQEESNNKNEEMGLERTDYTEEQALLLSRLNSITAGILQEHGTTPAILLASYGGLAMPATDASSNPAAAAVKKTGPIGTTSVVAAVTAQNASAAPGSLAANAPFEAADKVNGKVYKVNDISTNKDESIWSVISNRYFKSAFPRLIEY